MGKVEKYQFGKVTGEQAYDKMIQAICVSVHGAQNNILDMYWEIGGLIYSFINSKTDDNVSAALKQIAQHVKEASNDRLQELKPDSLRNALKIRESFDKNALDLAKAGCVSLRNLLPMCQNDVTPEERDQLLKEVVDGALDQTEIPARVQEEHPQELREEKRGGSRKKKEAPLGFMQRVKRDMDKLLMDFQQDYPLHMSTVLSSEDETSKEEFNRHFEAIDNQVGLMNGLWVTNRAATKAYSESE